MHELRVMGAVELHVNATYMLNQFMENQKSVYGKIQSVKGDNLFSSHSLGQCLI